MALPIGVSDFAVPNPRRSSLESRHDSLGLDQPIPALTAGQQVLLGPLQIRLRRHSHGVKFEVFFAHVGQEIKVAHFYWR